MLNWFDEFQFKYAYHFISFFFSISTPFVADWKVTNIECVLERLLETCPNLEAISVSGWKEFTGDHLAFLVQKFKSLQRIDLSSVNVSSYPILYCLFLMVVETNGHSSG